MEGFCVLRCHTCVLLIVCLLQSICGLLSTKLTSIPLRADNDVQTFSHNVGCEFGGTRYEIDSQWHPILEPYGVMYCLKCTCDAVIKKGLLQQRGQVHCRRISRECPDVSKCPQTALLPPNSCCKICPENSEDRLTSIVSPAPYGRPAKLGPPSPNTYKIEHQAASSANTKTSASGSITEFSVLLSRTGNSTSDVIGKAYMTLEQSVLRMTIQLSSPLRVKKIGLKGKSGDNFYMTNSFHTSNGTSPMKICMVWRDAVRNTDQIKSDLSQLILSTVEHPTGELAGFIKTIKSKTLETFSAVLTNTGGQGHAGILSMGLELPGKTLAVRGSVTAPAAVLRGKHPITVEILRDRRVLFTQRQTVAITPYAGEFTMKWENLSISNLKQLARGRLSARLTLPKNAKITGSITTFSQCGALKALATGQDAVPKYETMGLAVAEFSLSPSGRIDYKVEVKDVESRIHEVMIETERTALSGSVRKITRLAKDISDSVHIKIEGVYDKTDAVGIQLLLEGKLFINIQTRIRTASAMRGQILRVPTHVTDHILMSERDTGTASLAWCDTSNCSLTCDILVPRASVRRDKSTKVFLDYWNQKQLLATFTETNLMEMVIKKTEVQQIGSTLPTLRLVTRDSTLYGQATIPEKCFADSPKLVLPAADQQSLPRRGWVDVPITLAHKCRYDKKIYADGESWKPADSGLACVTCSCKRNKAQCHPVVCPTVHCDNPVTLPGECCPACPKATDNTTQTCFFPGDHRDHAVGTVWHPFMHPGGYSKCAVCYCKPGGNGYDCKQTRCPVLSCSERLQETLPGECCPSCKVIQSTAVRHNTNLSRMQGDSDRHSSCIIGDKQYSNGESFNPQIGPLGVSGNVICTCRNGKLDCNKMECDCSKKIARKNRCCMKQCGFTEADMIRKKRRKQKNRSKDMIC